MAATYEEVEGWKVEGKVKGATHIVSVCDTFDWVDFPVFIMPNEHVERAVQYYKDLEMHKVNEVIVLIEPTEKVTVYDLYKSIGVLIEKANWNPDGMQGNSVMNMVEVKAMLLNAQKKLTTIMNNEGDK